MTEPERSPFEGVPAPLRNNLERRGFDQLTTIQRAVVDASSEGRNLRLTSQTGSGKTVALGFVLYPALVGASEGPSPCALIIVPTRELAGQLRVELGWLLEGCEGVRVEVVTGGTDVRSEQRRLRSVPRVVVGTPGRLLDHVRSGALDLSQVQEVVLDEADQMFDMGFKDELESLVERLPEQRRSHLVSATFPPAVKALAARFQKDPLHLEGTALGAANRDIAHVAHLVFESDRYPALLNVLLANLGRRCLVFVQRRVDAATVAEKLAADGFAALPLSGDLPQAQRDRTLASFKSGTIQVLVATDVAARGIHVDDIALVVHGDVPRDPEVYTHRSGRTGRAGQSGQSVLLVVPQARWRTEGLLKAARVDVQWLPVPTPKKIRRAVTKQSRRRLHAQLALAGEPALLQPSELEYAAQLLASTDPQQLVATLLKLSEPVLPAVPRQITEPELHASRPRPLHDPRQRLGTSRAYGAAKHRTVPRPGGAAPKAGRFVAGGEVGARGLRPKKAGPNRAPLRKRPIVVSNRSKNDEE
jgi:ATP-dependent RNA helicase DeaD